MRKVFVFKGTLTAEQPVSYSVPSESKNAEHTLPRLGKQLYLTASGLRGVLRHAAAEIVMDLIDADPARAKLTMDDYFLLAMGGVKDAKNPAKKKGPAGGVSEETPEGEGEDGEEKKTVSDADVVRILRANQHARAHNPLVRLFGSMRHGVSGSLYCAHALAPEGTETTRVRHVRSNDFQREPELLERLEGGALDAFISRQAEAAVRSEGNQRIKDLKRELLKARKDGKRERVKEIEAEIKTVQDSLPLDVQIQLPNITYEAIPAGTVFTHEFVLSNPTDAEVALFLRALDRFALNPLIGGHRAHGLGRVSGHWSVRMRPEGQREFADMGEVSFDGDFGCLELTGRIAKFFESWDAFVAEKDTLEFTEAGIAAA
jgi:hypothetical protein